MCMRDWRGRPGVGGLTDSFTMLDVATTCKYSIPGDSLGTLETVQALQSVCGAQATRLVYSGNHRSTGKIL